MQLVESFSKRRDFGYQLHFNEASSRIAGLLDWMESQPAINLIMIDIQNKIDVNPLLAESGHWKPPPAKSPEEITSVCLFLMNRCREGDELGILAADHGITPSYQTNDIQPFVDAAVERYIQPGLDLIEERLKASLNKVTVDSMISNRTSLIVSKNLSQDFPSTLKLLQDVSSLFSDPSPSENWPNVGNSCRAAMIEFSNELLNLEIVEIPDEIKTGDFKEIVRLHLESVSLAKNDRFNRSLKNLTMDLWDHSSSMLHKKHVTMDQAYRVYVWTAMTLADVGSLFNNKREQNSS